MRDARWGSGMEACRTIFEGGTMQVLKNGDDGREGLVLAIANSQPTTVILVISETDG